MSKQTETENGLGEQLARVTAEREALRCQVTTLQAELEVARKAIGELEGVNAAKEQQIARLEAKRAAYAEWLTALVPPPPPFTAEELEDMRQNGITFDQILAEIDPPDGR
ncbi:MAG: hypothetical protein IT429_06130 [Gemmataceae bacterium]|nr:hypothetical protein [Gemmataceae bacterium]